MALLIAARHASRLASAVPVAAAPCLRFQDLQGRRWNSGAPFRVRKQADQGLPAYLQYLTSETRNSMATLNKEDPTTWTPDALAKKFKMDPLW